MVANEFSIKYFIKIREFLKLTKNLEIFQKNSMLNLVYFSKVQILSKGELMYDSK